MKSFLLFLIVIGLVLIVQSYSSQFKTCPLPQIEYRYIPRSFYDEQMNSVSVKSTYSDMFNEPETWSQYPLNRLDLQEGLPKDNFILGAQRQTATL